MKDMSIRVKILGGVAIIMLLGAIVVVVYLHQSYSSGLDVAAQRVASESVEVWNVLESVAADEYGAVGVNDTVDDYLQALKDVTGADYGLLLSKEGLDADEYAAAREAMGLADNWDEREQYALVATTDDALADKMRFAADADSIPEIGKVVGIENGACTKTCHGGLEAEGDYWTVAWSDDSRSRAHGVFPIVDADRQTIGVVYVVKDISASADAAKESMLRTLAVIGATLLLAAVIIGGMLDTLVFRRLGRMIVTMEDISIQVAGGGFDTTFEPDDRNDEIGEFEKFFAKFLTLVSSAFKQIHGRS